MSISQNINSLWDFSLNNNLHYIGWSIFECVLAITHTMVLLGIRNSTLKHLRKMQIYFLLDGFTHLFCIIQYPVSEIGYFGYVNSRYMLAIHIYYWFNLIINPPSSSSEGLKPVFHWSCVECKDDRFNRKYLIEIIGTTLDIVAHATGAALVMKFLSFKENLLVFVATIISTYLGIFWWYGDDFSTGEHMMPETLKSISRKGSEVIETIRTRSSSIGIESKKDQ